MSLQPLSASHRVDELHPRAQCTHGRKLLDGKTSMAMPFDASTRASVTNATAAD
jgi:hypothetical protein